MPQIYRVWAYSFLWYRRVIYQEVFLPGHLPLYGLFVTCFAMSPGRL